MVKKKSIPAQLQIWFEARQRYHLTDTQIQMARELGLNPKKFGGYANQRQEPWKRPLGEFIEQLYFKRFKKTEPARVLSMEQQAEESRQKQVKQEARKRLRQAEGIKPHPEAPENQS